MTKKSVFEAIKHKFASKEANASPATEEQSIQIQLPNNCQIIIGNMVEALENKMIVDPANAQTMDGNGGVSGAIKAYFKKIGKLDLYEKHIHETTAINGLVCPNGEVRFTSTDGIDIVHTSVPDLREKNNRVNNQATNEAKQKMFDAYYHAFEFAHLHQAEQPKVLDCPLLGAGIFKWSPQVSAEIAGRALQAFRTAYGDKLLINICIRPTDLNQGFTQEDMISAIQSGVEQQVTEPMRPSGMAKFDFNDSLSMRRHLGAVSIQALQQHYNEYVASGRPKTDKDGLLIDMLRTGFSKISANDRVINPRVDPWLAFALLSTLKKECNRANEKDVVTPAFSKLCDDYLDKVATLINPDLLKKYARDDNYIANQYNALEMPEFPGFNPSAPLFTQSDENLQYSQLFPQQGFIPENPEPKKPNYPDLAPLYSAYKDLLRQPQQGVGVTVDEKDAAPKFK
ncbi:MAG: macro domain-containing protein [Proteobacteria bacterium]|nr:macro domain-containing protein [Pseudomonadota bacterium]